MVCASHVHTHIYSVQTHGAYRYQYLRRKCYLNESLNNYLVYTLVNYVKTWIYHESVIWLGVDKFTRSIDCYIFNVPVYWVIIDSSHLTKIIIRVHERDSENFGSISIILILYVFKDDWKRIILYVLREGFFDKDLKI